MPAADTPGGSGHVRRTWRAPGSGLADGQVAQAELGPAAALGVLHVDAAAAVPQRAALARRPVGPALLVHEGVVAVVDLAVVHHPDVPVVVLDGEPLVGDHDAQREAL